MSYRRSFLKRIPLAFASAIATSPVAKAQSLPLKAAFVHHGLYWLKDKDDKESYTRMLKSFKDLKKIEEVKFIHVGAPSISDIDYEARATDATYTFPYLVLFNSKKDKENYLKHPLHSKFFSDFKDVVSKVKIYDSLDITD